MAGSLKSRETRQLSSSSLIKGSFSRGEGSSSFDSPSSPSGRGRSGMPSDLVEKRAWEMRLSLTQTIVLWSVLTGTMVMVFLFGLYAGREQGINIALEGHSGEAVRLPVANPIAAGEDKLPSDSLLADLNPAGLTPGAGSDSAAPAAKRESASSKETVPAEPAPEIDFSAAAKQSAANKLTEPLEKGATEAAPSVGKNAAPGIPPTAGVVNAPQPEAEAPAKSTAEKNQPVKTIKTSAIPAGWYLQIAAARTSKEANAVVRKLQSAGLKPIVETADISRATYYRVVLGPYATREATAAPRKAAMAVKAAKGEPFLKLIK